MDNVIYIDVLIAVNIFIDFFLLLAASKLISRKTKRFRLLAGSVFAGLLSLLILAEFGGFLLFALKIAGLAAVVLITFGFKSFALYIKTLFVFLAVNFVFAGVITAVWFILSPADMLVKNGVVYFNISPLVLVAATAAAYLVMAAAERILKSRRDESRIYTVKIILDGKCVELNALYDTGNNIVDAISGHPVTVCELNCIDKLLSYDDAVSISEFICKGAPIESASLVKKNLKLVPYHVINSSGIMVCIVPDSIAVKINGEYKEIESEIGITSCRLSQGEFQAILNSKCLNKI